ncbi:hypothetical protein LPJ55_005735 [Coemansia sp. RSA 990]|nr:WD40-repeat-containing domain protein [Coemansia mojavensis]KAJ1738269.1 hypothetical protein LPJ68_005686 [Coemansia sp. RSA 1086]KAJ1752259.1 hypothetical protein LPJ79_001337 [Coemansia sp. RSA 1821]KAJ1868850.1 hypothetical protein LPJ55_005735 [Coemansia sp. RSA 990]KAJ2648770.1 hypothetical protein IWW40_003713 [Coemansia sp. RSA 1250]KAJ2671034.1 hypothetical protein IWW42_003586 [Coemansia sp. RSA 1085]
MVAPPANWNRYVLSSHSPQTNNAPLAVNESKLYRYSIVDSYEFVKPAPKRHQQRTSWNHWQLRDVVVCPSTKPELYSIYRCNIDRYDINKNQSTRILGDLEFDPVSMAVGGDYIVAGGQRAELAVARLSDPQATTVVRSGGSINNFVTMDRAPSAIPRRRFRDSAAFADDGVTSLNITRDSSMPRLLVCNNDHTVRLMSLPDLELITELKFPTAVNYAAVSPDGTKMCVVGDTNQVFLFNKRGDEFENIAILTASNDASFSCDWSQCSELFAVGSQDGFVTVWDVRTRHKLAQLETYQYGRSRGACRNVKFSPSGSIDLLAFSEHTSYVNIVDTRSFEKRQVLRVNSDSFNDLPDFFAPDSPAMASQDTQITGLRFAPDSSSLFVGLEESILEYAVDRIGRYSFASSEII